MTADSYADNRREAYRDGVTNLAVFLRNLANRVEQVGAPHETATIPAVGRHVQAAERVVDEVAWGVANAHLAALMTKAAMADVAEVEERS